jgi:hypothetical protein
MDALGMHIHVHMRPEVVIYTSSNGHGNMDVLGMHIHVNMRPEVVIYTSSNGLLKMDVYYSNVQKLFLRIVVLQQHPNSYIETSLKNKMKLNGGLKW